MAAQADRYLRCICSLPPRPEKPHRKGKSVEAGNLLQGLPPCPLRTAASNQPQKHPSAPAPNPAASRFLSPRGGNHRKLQWGPVARARCLVPDRDPHFPRCGGHQNPANPAQNPSPVHPERKPFITVTSVFSEEPRGTAQNQQDVSRNPETPGTTTNADTECHPSGASHPKIPCADPRGTLEAADPQPLPPRHCLLFGAMPLHVSQLWEFFPS